MWYNGRHELAKYFDASISLGFTGLANRQHLLAQELDRVGIKAFQTWQFPTPFDKVLQRGMVCRAGMQAIPYFNSGMGHYRAVKTAYHLGANTCLIIEDDIRFLKDLARLETELDAMPKDWDIVLLDVLKADADPVEVVTRNNAVNRVSGCWTRSWGNPRSFGCYGLSRRAMEWLIGRIEAPAVSPGVILRNVDLNLRADRAQGLNVYYASPNLAVQTLVGNQPFNSSRGDLFKYYKFYTAIGVDLRDYENVESLDEFFAAQ